MAAYRPEIVDPYQVVFKLRDICSVTENQPVIVRRNMVASLVSFLRGRMPDGRVSQLAAESLRYLASHPDNRELMANDISLLDALASVFTFPETNRVTQELISDIASYLAPHLESNKENSNILDNVFAFQIGQRQSSTPPVALDGVQQAAVVTTHTRPRQVTLKVPSMTSEDIRRKVETALATQRGITSYSLDVATREATLFTNLNAQKLSTLFTEVGFPAEIKEDRAPEGPEEPVEDAEDETPEFQVQTPSKGRRTSSSIGTSPDSSYKRSLVIAGGDDSLQARFERKQRPQAKTVSQQQQPQAEEAGVKKFITKITSFFW